MKLMEWNKLIPAFRIWFWTFVFDFGHYLAAHAVNNHLVKLGVVDVPRAVGAKWNPIEMRSGPFMQEPFIYTAPEKAKWEKGTSPFIPAEYEKSFGATPFCNWANGTTMESGQHQRRKGFGEIQNHLWIDLGDDE